MEGEKKRKARGDSEGKENIATVQHPGGAFHRRAKTALGWFALVLYVEVTALVPFYTFLFPCFGR